MAINSTFYLDAADLASAVSVYLDSSLANIAPDGFYSDGTIVREQSSGILLAANTCGTCGTPCGSSIADDGGTGIYLINLDTGSTSLDVGAIIIKFNPQSIPDGIRAVYDGTVYNKLSSEYDGLHQSSTPGNFTVVGKSSSDCGLSGSTTNVPAATEYLYVGTNFIATGDTQNLTIYPGDVSLTPLADPSWCYMVIPKPNPTPNDVNIQIFGPCSTTGWFFRAYCPTLLDSFTSSVMFVAPTIPCSTTQSETFYFAKVHTAADTYVGVHDFVFTDAYGEFPLSDGYYLISNVASPNKVIQVSNGIVVAITNCI